MTKLVIAVLAVSVSLFAVACGGGQEAAKTEPTTPAADTASSATPAATPAPEGSAAPAADAPK